MLSRDDCSAAQTAAIGLLGRLTDYAVAHIFILKKYIWKSVLSRLACSSACHNVSVAQYVGLATLLYIAGQSFTVCIKEIVLQSINQQTTLHMHA